MLAHVLHALALAALAFLALVSLSTLVHCHHCCQFLPFSLPYFLVFAVCQAYAQCAQSISATDLRCVMSADGGHMSRLIFPLIVTTLSLVLTNTASTKFELFSFQCINNEKYFFFRLKMKKIQKFSEG